MTSKERLSACWNGQPHDYIPLTTWCFGLQPKKDLCWEKAGKTVKHWYSMRMEHLHTLEEPWGLEDDFRRALAWQSLGVDDVLDISVPWSIDPEVIWSDSLVKEETKTSNPVMVREYTTPSGKLWHAVKRTGEHPGDGWVVQPDHVPLFEDYNIPRGIEHAVSSPSDIPIISHLYKSPSEEKSEQFNRRITAINKFSMEHGFPVQAWSAFGMDGIVWLTGIEGAIMLALDDPYSFHKLVDIVHEADYGRTELACKSPTVDMVVQRGWYSSTDFWSPNLFNEYVYPYIAQLAKLSHSHGKKFAYTMTTGVEILGERLAEAGVDVLYFIDPIQDTISLEKARENLSKRMALVGGINTVTLTSKDKGNIQDSVKRAIDILGPTKRFILHPVDALFPDTPWESVEIMVETWKHYR